jgi:hypothetical protein
MMAQKEFNIPTYILNVCYCIAPIYGWFFCIFLEMNIVGISMIKNMCEFTAMVWSI